MGIIVKKFGGTSVANIERIKRVANIVANSGEKVIVVVSAMAGMTNELIHYSDQLGPITTSSGLSEYDTVISSGEQITSGLMAIALMSLGLKSKSYLGWQLPIETNNDFSQGKIVNIEKAQLLHDLDSGIIPVVAGFQGMYNGRITTLGRGGSDTTAVAIAVATGAKRCDIYTDVDGIYSADPRIVPKAKKIDKIDYISVLEMASAGAKVIHPRAVEIAMNSSLPIRILNTFSHDVGTEITESKMEKVVVNGIAVKNNLAMITIPKVENIDKVIRDIVALGVIIESVTQSNLSFDQGGNTNYDYSILVGSEYIERCKSIIYGDVILREKISKIAVIGIGVKDLLIDILKSAGSIMGLQVLETQVSLLVEGINSDKVIRDLHTSLGLD
jgi:aspartate kinase